MPKKLITTAEVRQDQRDGSPTYGAVAVKLPEAVHALMGEWGVMALTSGGSYVPESVVADWAVLGSE